MSRRIKSKSEQNPALAALLMRHGQRVRKAFGLQILQACVCAVAVADLAGVAILAGVANATVWMLAAGGAALPVALYLLLHRPKPTLTQTGACLDRAAGLPGIGLTLAHLHMQEAGKAGALRPVAEAPQRAADSDMPGNPATHDMEEAFLASCGESVARAFLQAKVSAAAGAHRLLLLPPAVLGLELLLMLVLAPAPASVLDPSRLMPRNQPETGTATTNGQPDEAAQPKDNNAEGEAQARERQHRQELAHKLSQLLQEGAEDGAGEGAGTGATPAGTVPMQAHYHPAQEPLDLYRNRRPIGTDQTAIPPEYAGVAQAYMRALSQESAPSPEPPASPPGLAPVQASPDKARIKP